MGSGTISFTKFTGCDGVKYTAQPNSGQSKGSGTVYHYAVPGETIERYFVLGKGWVGVSGTSGCTSPDQKEPPTKRTFVDGPRLDNLSVSSAAYGEPRPIGFGTVPMDGHMIWSPGLSEKKNIQRKIVKGGKQQEGTDTTTTTYSYSASAAIAFGEGPCSDILRIWANGALIFDKTDATRVSRKVGFNFTLYKGTEDQLPDPLILLREGRAYTPAFRGTVYIVIEDLLLADFGDQWPSIKAEITYDLTNTRPQILSGSSISTVLNTWDAGTVAIDWDRGYAYYVSVGALASNGISRVNINTALKDREGLAKDVLNQNSPQGLSRFHTNGVVAVMPDGALVASIFSNSPFSSNSGPIVRIDPTSLKETARFGEGGSALGMEVTRFAFCQLITPISIIAGNGTSDYVLCGSTLNNEFGILSLPDLKYVWDSDTSLVGGLGAAKLLAMSKGAQGEAWVLAGADYTASSSSDVLLYKVVINKNGGVSVTLHETWTVPTLMAGETLLNKAGPMVYDEINNRLMLFIEGAASGVQYIIVYDIANQKFLYYTDDLNVNPSTHHWENSRLIDDTFGFIVGNNGVQINTRTGDLVFNNVLPNWTFSEGRGGAGSYDSRSESFIGFVDNPAGKPMIRFYFNRGGGNGENLDTIITNLVGRVGLSPTELNVSDVASITVPGYAIRKRTSVREAVEVLTDVYIIDSVESDWKLKFTQRGGAPIRNLMQKQLGIFQSKIGSIVEEDRLEEVELPVSYTIQYQDKTNDYAQSAHQSKRIVEPQPSMQSSNRIIKEYELALHPDVAKQQSEKILYSSWIARAGYKMVMPWEQLDLDPADVVTITLDDGTVFETRLTNFDIGNNFTIKVKARSEAETLYVSTAVADAGSGVIDQTISDNAFIKTLLLDMPLRSDLDEPAGRSANPLYFFMGGFTENGFQNGSLYQSTDDINFAIVGTEVNSMTWGTTTAAMPDPKDGRPFITDDTSSLTIVISSGKANMVSISELQMLQDGNQAALVKVNGEIEIINYQTVADNSDGSFTLTNFLRGRRGTDTMAFDHTAGETFVLLSESFVGETFLDELSHRAVKVNYRGVGNGQFFAQGEILDLTTKHRALMPYAPLNHTAVVDGSSNIDFTWVRRTRVGGKLEDVTGTVPLSEDTEGYEIDILTGEGGLVLRTVTGLVTPLYKYLNADIVTDFGSLPSEIWVNVYQVSAQAGRGFTRTTGLGLPDLATDKFLSSVVFLTSFDGADADTSAIDDSANAHIMTFGGDAQLDSAQKKFGTTSLLLDGTGDTVTAVDHADFDLGAEFTIEGFFRWNTVPGGETGLIGQWYSAVSARQWKLTYDGTNLEFHYSANGISDTTTASYAWTPVTGVQYHLAVDRDSLGDIRIYEDGVFKNKVNDATAISTAGTPTLGIGNLQSGNLFDGHVDEVRITNGVARYASDGGFTAPAQRFLRS